MIYIYKDRIINIQWTVMKGTSQVRENFDRALLKMFLIGPHEKYLLEATAEEGVVSAEVPSGLPEGTYSVELIYVKNWQSLQRPPEIHKNQPHDCRFNSRCIMRSRKDDLFAITEYETESENIGHGEVIVRLKTSVASYGYDGLSAYEIAVMRGDFTGSEGEWIESLSNGVIKIDKELSETSKNPVENQATTNGLKSKQDKLVSGENIKTINDKSILGEGNIEIPTVTADDEDLVLVENNNQDEEETIKQLKFANKAYKPAEFSGMGRVYLRKNIVDGKNVLTQNMISKENTRYIIQYDYDLNGGEITVPENCVLKFEGGSFKNGTIHFDDTVISAEGTIFKNISYSGKIINYINVKWFGAIGDGITDDTQAFLEALRSYQDYDYVYLTKNAGNTIYVPRGSYIISETLYLRKGCVLKGDGSGNTFIDYKKSSGYAIIMGNTPSDDENKPNGTNDPGGLQPIVQDLFITSSLGGNGIFISVDGYKITNCWFTCGISITASGVDGIISKCVNDNGSVFLKLNTTVSDSTDYDKSHSIVISDCITYACTYCSVWLNGAYGVVFNNCFFYYSRTHSVLIESDSGNIQFNNCDFRLSLSPNYYNSDSSHFYSISGGLKESILNSCIFSCSRKYDITIYKWRNTLISNCIFKDSNNISLYIANGSNIHIHGCTFIRIKNSPLLIEAKSYIDENIFIDCNKETKTNPWDNACIRVSGQYSSGSILRNNICNNDNFVSSFTTTSINNICYGNKSLKNYDSFVYTNSGGTFENERTQSFSDLAKIHSGGTQYTPKLDDTDGGFNYFNREHHQNYLWDGQSWRNIDGTNPNKVVIHNYNYDNIESIINDFNKVGNGAVHKIVSDIDLHGGTLQINMDCTLVFDGGTISNGTLRLTGTKVLPFGIDISEHVIATISGTYKEGQILYDSSLKKMKLWNGSEWTNVDGTPL